MNISYGASRYEVYAALSAMDDKTLRGVLTQLQLDFKRVNRRYVVTTIGSLAVIIGISMGLLLLFNDKFPQVETFRYWYFHLTVGVLFPMIGTWILNVRLTRPYWIWRGYFTIWLSAIDNVTYERFVGP